MLLFHKKVLSDFVFEVSLYIYIGIGLLCVFPLDFLYEPLPADVSSLVTSRPPASSSSFRPRRKPVSSPRPPVSSLRFLGSPGLLRVPFHKFPAASPSLFRRFAHLTRSRPCLLLPRSIPYPIFVAVDRLIAGYLPPFPLLPSSPRVPPSLPLPAWVCVFFFRFFFVCFVWWSVGQTKLQ